MPRLAPLSVIAFLNSGASTSRAATMIASPETPILSLATGPTVMATGSWILAEPGVGAVVLLDMGRGQLLVQMRNHSGGGGHARRHDRQQAITAIIP